MSATGRIPLSEVCRQDRGSVRPGELNHLRYLGMESIESGTGQLAHGDLTKTPEAPEANAFRFTPAHVLYGKLRPYLNKVFAPDFEGKCSTELVPLLPCERLDRRYLAYFLRSPGTVAAISQKVAGARMPRADMSFVMSLSIPLPALETQRRIVELLSHAENIVRMRREAEKRAKEIIPALFLEMFGDPATNPKGWAIRRLGDLVERLEGGKNIQAGATGDSPYRILKISAVTSGSYDETESKPAPADFDPPAHYFVREGDILFSRANTEALVGATAMVDSTAGKALLPDKLWRLALRPAEGVAPAYMLALLQNRSVRKELSKMASGTGGSMKNISQAKLIELRLPIAPAGLQRAFQERVSTVRGLLHGAYRAGQVAEQTLQSLLAGVFSEGMAI